MVFFFFFNDTATTEIYTLSLHDALPISVGEDRPPESAPARLPRLLPHLRFGHARPHEQREQRRQRSEEHTSELQSQSNLVCRLLLEKKKSTRSLRRRAVSASPNCAISQL